MFFLLILAKSLARRMHVSFVNFVAGIPVNPEPLPSYTLHKLHFAHLISFHAFIKQILLLTLDERFVTKKLSQRFAAHRDERLSAHRAGHSAGSSTDHRNY